MTVSERMMLSAAEVYLVHTQVLNMHEYMKLESKLDKVGRIIYGGYMRGADNWHRPTVRSAVFIVVVRPEDRQKLKAMIKQLNKEIASHITYFPL